MSQLVITQQVINEVHERLQYDDDFDCEYLKDVPLTAAGLLATVNHLGPLYGRESTLIVLAWSAAEALIKESVEIFCSRNWNLNLFEAGYVGDLAGKVPVVASIQAGSDYAILTVAPGPLQIENEKGVPNNSVLAFWKVP